ncbi:flagellar biosynthesis anti-sigma factor FlgM [Candidatus Oleimmundimicrobium sp.]|uniref:flagellar biosynthesis anti-sigma factor FlgM n=1 Tax=Candidatus Oleimmundimicrobium sp. TaxID=3060597 RepID=UPI00271F58E6|nr:flagellar biosynthesis anti-sigma factor FlgM [Candidatus Oleimmundimicrobium sp.]MDO8886575.1 flagellar biosynthesis anti-sigma factor FlgM [Candidatus Oleimmundimicrobium sp.]
MKEKFSVKVAGNKTKSKSKKRVKGLFFLDKSCRNIDVKEIKKRIELNNYNVPSQDIAEKMLSVDAERRHFYNWVRRKLV